MANISEKFPGARARGRQHLSEAVQCAEGYGLRYFRLRAGLSQVELAELSGLKQDVISNIERDIKHRNPQIDTLYKLAKALKLNKTELGQLVSEDYDE